GAAIGSGHAAAGVSALATEAMHSDRASACQRNSRTLIVPPRTAPDRATVPLAFSKMRQPLLGAAGEYNASFSSASLDAALTQRLRREHVGRRLQREVVFLFLVVQALCKVAARLQVVVRFQR